MFEGMIVYLPGLILFLTGIAFVIINLVLSHVVHPHVRVHDKYVSYECGEDPVGNAWIQFNHRFYLVALVFVIFDVEVVLLFPWVLVFKEFGWFGLFEIAVFLGILVCALIYAWGKGALVWDKPRPRYTDARAVQTPLLAEGELSHAELP